MSSVLADNDLYGLDSKIASRGVASVKRPPLVGWRIEAYARPHLRNQLIRRYSRKVPSSASVYSLEDARVAKATRAKQQQQQQREAETLRREFLKHSKKWRQDTAVMSSVSDMVLHASYLRIIGMGRAAVPLIIAELRKEPEHWFRALEAITGQNPVTDADRGRVKNMAQRWLDWWAKEEEIIE